MKENDADRSLQSGPTDVMTEACKKYAQYMYEIKYRTSVISRVLERYYSGTSLTGYKESDIELCLLQLRKCLELVMFASLVAHAAEGAKLQKSLVEKEWNATKILHFLSGINPAFFPQALLKPPMTDSDPPAMIPVDGALTKIEFGELYDRVCGKYLHASRDPAVYVDHPTLFGEISGWLNKLLLLLSSHWTVVSADTAFAVLLNTRPSGYVQVIPMRAEKP